MSALVNWIEFAKLLSHKLQNQQNDTSKILSIFQKLKAIPMTLEILKETKIGKIVNTFRKHPDAKISTLAKEIVADWKLIASSYSNQVKKTEKSPEKFAKLVKNNKNYIDDDNVKFIESQNKFNLEENFNDALNNRNIHNKSDKLLHSNKGSTKHVQSNAYISSANKIYNISHTSINEKHTNSLPLQSPTCHHISRETSNTSSDYENDYSVHIDNNVPLSDQIYEPTPINTPNICYKKESINKNNAFSEDFFLQKSKTRTQVYSGRKENLRSGGKGGQRVPSLLKTCTTVLLDNIDSIECIGSVPYHLISPVLVKCTPSQLFNLEHFNPKLLNDTDTYWEKHCSREFKVSYSRRCSFLKNHHLDKIGKNGCLDDESFDEYDTWRDFYLSQLDARESRLKKITANISAGIKKSTPGPRVKLAFMSGTAKPPRNVIRKQQMFGLVLGNQNNGKTKAFNDSINTNNASISLTSKYYSNDMDITSSLAGNSSRISNLEVDPERYKGPKG
ncbi:unnamed protein product [Gordionus sp. m RMFG-2023]